MVELALSPGDFIRDPRLLSFVGGLEEVAAQGEILLKIDSALAAGLHETLLAGCREKPKNSTTRAAASGQFAKDLICQWIKADGRLLPIQKKRREVCSGAVPSVAHGTTFVDQSLAVD